VRLETLGSSGNYIPGGLFIGQASDQGITGGVPFNESPDSVKGYAKYNILPGDSAFLYVFFKLAGNPIGVSFTNFTGSQNSYVQFESNIMWFGPPVMPDTMAVAIISSSPETSVNAGNYIILDNLSLIGSTGQIPNGDFEYWTPAGSEEPDNWLTSNAASMNSGGPSVTKTTDAYEGQYAARLENMVIMNSDTMSFITNGHIGQNGPEGGMPVTHNPDKLSFYYKYFPVGPDTALAALISYRYDATGDSTVKIEEIYVNLNSVSNYTYFEIQATYDSVPLADTVNIAFSAGNVEEDTAYVGVGSVLYVDDVQLTFKPKINIQELEKLFKKSIVYPNPAYTKVYIDPGYIKTGDYYFSLFDSFGKLIFNKPLKFSGGNIPEISFKGTDAGLYTYRIQSTSVLFSGKLCILR
jgi:hypothetical protein